MFTWSIFVATIILGAPLPTAKPVTPPPKQVAAEQTSSVREILSKFEKRHKQSTDRPSVKQNLTLEMECLVKLMRIGPTTVPVLIDCLKNQKTPASTRAFAARALGFFGDVRARPVLLQGMEDPDGYVATYSRFALGRLGRIRATPKLRQLAGTAPDSSGYFDATFIMTRDDEPNPEPIRRALRNYDLARMDSAHLGKPAPDFTLADSSGKLWHLGQFRGQKAVVLIFLTGIN
jgi:HEAT repeats